MLKIFSGTKKKPAKDEFLKHYKDPGLAEYIWYLSSAWRIMWSNFLAGIARGFGFVLGATVVVALALFILSKILVQIPLVGDFFEWLNQFIQESLQNGNFTGGSKSMGL